MNGLKLLYFTVYLSLLVQIITGIVTFSGVFYNLKDEDKILSETLTLESIVQVVEGIFYIYIAMSLKYINSNILTQRRYLDWIITTPMMLLSTIMYMEYENKKVTKEIIRAKSFIDKNRKNITNMFLCNALMLLSGYLGETGMIKKKISIPIGFLFLILSFGIMYTNYVGDLAINKQIFFLMLLIWSLYGVAALMPVITKNISYNILDVVSKNFYGLFLFFKVRNISKGYK